MKERPPLPQSIWDTLSPEAQAAVSVLVQSFERRIADLEEGIGKNSTNSSRPPSSDPPSVKRPPPAPASGKKRGGQPGHRRQARPLVPPEQLRQIIDCKPPECRWCHQPLQGDDPEPIRHQVAELPPVRPTVDEYRLHRLTCPRCRTSTCAALPPGVPQGSFGPRLRAILSVQAGGYRLVLQLYLIRRLRAPLPVVTSSCECLMGPSPLRPAQRRFEPRQPAPEQPHQQPTDLRHRQTDQPAAVLRLFLGASSATVLTTARTAWASNASVTWRCQPARLRTS